MTTVLRRRSCRSRGRRGFSLIELMIVLAIIATMSAMVVPRYRRAIEKSKETVAIEDIKSIQSKIDFYWAAHGALPPKLDVLEGAPFLDPWGNEYQYLDFGSPKAKGFARKDKFLVPLNSSYDLYSRGADGKSQVALTAKDSQDDIVRANDGDYVGIAELY